MRARVVLVVLACAACADAPRTGTKRPVATAPPPPPSAVEDAGQPPRGSGKLQGWPEEPRGPGFPEAGPWVSFYGGAAQMGDLARVAKTFRIINIDADPTAANFTDAQLETLKAGGQNRVLSYMNVGACERYRSYWSSAPPGFVSCSANRTAQRGIYEGYPDETWMDVGDPDYQKLIVEHVAPRLAPRVDGFYLDNMEIVEHSPTAKTGSCSATCKQGGLDLVRMLRAAFPKHLIVMQNATGAFTRTGKTDGIPFPMLLDGIAHEEVYAPHYDESAEEELVAWRNMKLVTPSGRPFWIATEDYVGSCANKPAASAALARSRAKGFSPCVSDESGSQKVVCYWE